MPESWDYKISFSDNFFQLMEIFLTSAHFFANEVESGDGSDWWRVLTCWTLEGDYGGSDIPWRLLHWPQYCRGLQGFKRRQNIFTANCEASDLVEGFPQLFFRYSMSTLCLTTSEGDVSGGSLVTERNRCQGRLQSDALKCLNTN